MTATLTEDRRGCHSGVREKATAGYPAAGALEVRQVFQGREGKGWVGQRHCESGGMNTYIYILYI